MAAILSRGDELIGVTILSSYSIKNDAPSKKMMKIAKALEFALSHRFVNNHVFQVDPHDNNVIIMSFWRNNYVIITSCACWVTNNLDQFICGSYNDYYMWCFEDFWTIKRGWGLGVFLRWWPPSTIWAGHFIFHGHHRGCLNNPIFSNLGLCAACWAHFMCHHELWPTSVSHPFSFFDSSLCLAGGKQYQEISIPVFRVVLQNFPVPGYFPYTFFYRYILFLHFWVGLLLEYVSLFQSGS